MLDKKEYLKRNNGLREARLDKLLDSGHVRGAVKRGESWLIPENALIEYYPGYLSATPSFDNTMVHILRALNGNNYIDARILGCSEPFYEDALANLLEAGLITRSVAPADGVTSTGFRLTERGRLSELINRKSKMKAAIKLLADFIPNITIPV